MTEVMERYTGKWMARGAREGYERGIEQGLERGRAQGEGMLGRLVGELIAQGRVDDAARAASDPTYRARLYREMSIEAA